MAIGGGKVKEEDECGKVANGGDVNERKRIGMVSTKHRKKVKGKNGGGGEG